MQSVTDPCALYIDLIERCILGLIYEDENVYPGFPANYNNVFREAGYDWPASAHSMIGVQRMENVRAAVIHALLNKVPGDLMETGVWRGGTCIFMRAILRAYAITDRHVWVADSFEGLPTPDIEHYPADKTGDHHLYPQLAISLEDVKRNFERYGLLDDQVKFLKGWFKDTLPDAPVDKLAVLRLDGDMYESTLDALTALYDKLSPNGVLIVDDYSAFDACRQAVDDFRQERGITTPVQKVDWAGVYWVKQA